MFDWDTFCLGSYKVVKVTLAGCLFLPRVGNKSRFLKCTKWNISRFFVFPSVFKQNCAILTWESTLRKSWTTVKKFQFLQGVKRLDDRIFWASATLGTFWPFWALVTFGHSGHFGHFGHFWALWGTFGHSGHFWTLLGTLGTFGHSGHFCAL